MIQSGDGDWIINLIPPGTESQALKDALIQHSISVLNGQRAFYLAGTSTPNKKCHLRVLRASVVKSLFWTRVFFSKVSVDRFLKILYIPINNRQSAIVNLQSTINTGWRCRCFFVFREKRLRSEEIFEL